MKLALIVLILSRDVFAYNYTTKYIDVPLDHFSNNATFKLKYLINDQNWSDEGPIFFYTGNEGTIENFAENTGFMFDIAPEFNALIVFAEHRYYGETLPFGNLSFSSLEHVGYLTSNQALADFIFLINDLQNQYASRSQTKLPVIAFGGSYGGMLAAWIRMKYPSSVLGAIASSAPIWQFQGLTPCENFNRIVTNVYQTAQREEDCSAPLKNSWNAIRNITATDVGKDWLSKQWKLCTPLKTSTDVDVLVSWVSNVLINMAMVNYPYPSSFLAPLPAYPIRNFCYNLTATPPSDEKSLLRSLGLALQIYTNYTQTTQCVNINETAAALGESGWDFQACTEMIMPMCSDDRDMFENQSWNFTQYSDECYKRWGVKQSHPELPILEYGGKDISAASNIVFSNGLLDPWSSGGVLQNTSATVSAVIIPEGAHHLDLRPKNKDDPESVIEARLFHIRSIKNWIREYYKNEDGEFLEKVFERYFQPRVKRI